MSHGRRTIGTSKSNSSNGTSRSLILRIDEIIDVLKLQKLRLQERPWGRVKGTPTRVRWVEGNMMITNFVAGAALTHRSARRITKGEMT
eukprot:m.407097 g.407097  ORF g.407097 m.407097 type:complete len:89 (+) comp56504_c4_seq11:1071-1337(+)